MSNEYAWDYLRQSEPRASELWAIIAEYVRSAKNVLDINCGFAPLVPKFVPFIENYCGNDSNLQAIEHCSGAAAHLKDRERFT